MTTQRGTSLIEALVAILILMIGLLGIAGLLNKAHQAEMESYQRTHALIILQDIVHRLYANRLWITCYPGDSYGTDSFTTNTCANSHAIQDMNEIDTLLKGANVKQSTSNLGGLINAQACITYIASIDAYRVTIAWDGITPTISAHNHFSVSDDCFGGDATRHLISTYIRRGTLT